MGKPAFDLSRLTLEERLDLLDDLLDTLRRTPTLLDHADDVCREVDRKLDALMQEGPPGANWDAPLEKRDPPSTLPPSKRKDGTG